MTDRWREVWVTGLGPVTPIGIGCDAFWSSLHTGKLNVRARALPVDVARAVDLPLVSMLPAEEIPGMAGYADTLATQRCAGCRDLGYALLAARLALHDAGWEPDRLPARMGVVQAFEAPGIERTVSALFELLSTPPPPTGPGPVYDLLAPYFYAMQPFLYVHLMGKALGLHGLSTSVHNACTSGLVALHVAAQGIRDGSADAMLVVGGEAFETAVRLEWFRRLDVYAMSGTMRPFDAEPLGFYVGEGAGAILLEAADAAQGRGARPYAVYLGGSFAQQSAQQTVPDLSAARLAGVIGEALRNARVAARDVDLIVPHGAATTLCDAYEAKCLDQALGGQATDAVGTAFKPQVGHLLAASGVIDTVAALLAVRHSTVPPTLHTRPGHSVLPVPLAGELLTRPLNVLLKLSTGFTGHDAAVVFRRV